MIYSMTAFARADQHLNGHSLAWEIKTVNHRYLEINPRLPEALRALENTVRERCRARLARGKVDVTLRYQPDESSPSLQLNESLVKQLSDVARRVGDIVQHPGQVNPLEIMAYPGVLASENPDLDTLNQAALARVEQALDALLDTRQREGVAMAQVVEQRLDGIDEQVARVKDALPRIKEHLRQRLRTRVEEVVASPDPDRLEQELVLLAQKMDVDEELDRLDTHVQEVRRILASASKGDKASQIGRRLDFLMQELNREANTLASKSVDSDTTNAAVELKVLIEQMREQIQNIE